MESVESKCGLPDGECGLGGEGVGLTDGDCGLLCS